MTMKALVILTAVWRLKAKKRNPMASLLFVGATSICLRLRSSFASVLSSVTSITISATGFPNSRAIISIGDGGGGGGHGGGMGGEAAPF
jgi:hypothetical protein